jgi:hypothetical protein
MERGVVSSGDIEYLSGNRSRNSRGCMPGLRVDFGVRSLGSDPLATSRHCSARCNARMAGRLQNRWESGLPVACSDF